VQSKSSIGSREQPQATSKTDDPSTYVAASASLLAITPEFKKNLASGRHIIFWLFWLFRCYFTAVIKHSNAVRHSHKHPASVYSTRISFELYCQTILRTPIQNKSVKVAYGAKFVQVFLQGANVACYRESPS